MSTQADLLLRTKPLADPVRVIASLAFFGAVLVALVVLPLGNKLAALGSICLLLSFGILLMPGGAPNAIYLRAFRTDRSTARLRAELAAVLGPGFRLSGIRPPTKKTSMFLRFLAPGLVAVRYAGSKFMELEAGDDWMARLWKTYQNTRLVFIDVRDVTIHVHQEIQMTLETMGAERCIFLVDSRKSDAEWRDEIAAIAGPGVDSAHLQLLDAAAERIESRQMHADLKAILKTLPRGVPGETERGRQFILERVSEEQLRMSQRTSPMVVWSAVAAALLSVGSGRLMEWLPDTLALVLSAIVGLVSLWVLGSGYLRGGIRIARLAQAGHAGAAARAALILVLAVLLFAAGEVLISVPQLEAVQQARGEADEASAIGALHTLAVAEVTYQATFPDSGFACELSQLGGDPHSGPPSPQAAQLIGAGLASGRWSRYTFRVAKCIKTSVNGRELATDFEIDAVPGSPQGQRGFCIDSSGEIRVDPNGGSNCLELLRQPGAPF
jgi:type IV pilus assembly protein PilA